jgi:hypothetical protein
MIYFAIPLMLLAILFLVRAVRVEKRRLKRVNSPRRQLFADWQASAARAENQMALAFFSWGVALMILPGGAVAGLALFIVLALDGMRSSSKAKATLREMGITGADAMAGRVEFESRDS